jgi:hypothetical protein
MPPDVCSMYIYYNELFCVCLDVLLESKEVWNLTVVADAVSTVHYKLYGTDMVADLVKGCSQGSPTDPVLSETIFLWEP